MTRHADLSAMRTAYESRGDGPVIVLMHGAEASRASFDAVAETLSRHAHVVTYDQRGCGDTRDDGSEHHIPDLARDASELMACLGHARYSVMGTSLGGRVAQALAVLEPGRVERLVLCNTWPLSQRLSDLDPQGVARLQSLRAGLPASAAELAGLFYTPEYVARHPLVVDRYAKAPSVSRRGELAREAHGDLSPSRIEVPTLCIAGTRDEVVPLRVVREMAESLPHARLELLEGVGHAAAVLAPHALAMLIAGFLSPKGRS